MVRLTFTAVIYDEALALKNLPGTSIRWRRRHCVITYANVTLIHNGDCIIVRY